MFWLRSSNRGELLGGVWHRYAARMPCPAYEVTVIPQQGPAVPDASWKDGAPFCAVTKGRQKLVGQPDCRAGRGQQPIKAQARMGYGLTPLSSPATARVSCAQPQPWSRKPRKPFPASFHEGPATTELSSVPFYEVPTSPGWPLSTALTKHGPQTHELLDGTTWRRGFSWANHNISASSGCASPVRRCSAILRSARSIKDKAR